MSVVCILTPVVIAGWPAFSAAVVGAAASLGYAVVDEVETKTKTPRAAQKVEVEIPQSELVTGSLNRDDSITVQRDNITVTFSRDARGKASLCVSGDGCSKEELRARGEELAQGVVQHYVYQRLKEEMDQRQFAVVEEETTEDRSIRIKVRHWEE